MYPSLWSHTDVVEVHRLGRAASRVLWYFLSRVVSGLDHRLFAIPRQSLGVVGA